MVGSIRKSFAFRCLGVLGMLHVTDAVVTRDGQFADLRHAEEAAENATVRGSDARRERIARSLCLSFGHNVENAGGALRVVLGAGVGNDLDLLDGRRRIVLEDERRIGAHHLVWFTVNVDFESAAAVYLDVVLAVDGHHGHLAQHVEHGVGLGIGVVGNGVGDTVGFGLDKRAHGGDGGCSQRGGIFLKHKRADVGGSRSIDADSARQRRLAEADYLQRVGAALADGKRERAFLIGNTGGGRLCRIGRRKAKGGEGLGLARNGILDGAADSVGGGLAHECGGCQQGHDEK